MDTENKTDMGSQSPKPGCFEDWLCERLRERRDRQDEVGRVARFVLRENREGRWPPEGIVLARNGHGYDLLAHYERVLRHCENWPEEDIETFFRVYDLYLKDDCAEYDRKVEEISLETDKEDEEDAEVAEGGAGSGDGGGRPPTTTGDSDEESFSWESWTRFFYELHGPEGLGYEVDEDGYPISREPEGGIEEH